MWAILHLLKKSRASLDSLDAGEFIEYRGGRTVGATQNLHQRLVVRAGGVGSDQSGVAGPSFAQESGFDQAIDLAEHVGLGDARNRAPEKQAALILFAGSARLG